MTTELSPIKINFIYSVSVVEVDVEVALFSLLWGFKCLIPPLRSIADDERERASKPLGKGMNWIERVLRRIVNFRKFPGLLHWKEWGTLSFGFPLKAKYLRIDTSPSTILSLVGLYSFQGNLESGGEKHSWGVERRKDRQNAENMTMTAVS